MRRDPQRHAADWSSFVAGVAFAAVGAIAVIAGGDRFTDAVVWIWSGLLLGLGVALLLRGSSQYGAGDEVGAEGSEDREVEQAGGGHDG
jgi:hypothetical protein